VVLVDLDGASPAAGAPPGSGPSPAAGAPPGSGPSPAAGAPPGSGPSPAAGPPATRPAVVVGVSTMARPSLPPPACDVAFCAEVDPPPPWVGDPSGLRLKALEAAVAASPAASVVLAQLLRLTGSVSADAGLVAESLAYSTLQGGPDFRRWLASTPRPAPRADTGPAVEARRDGASLVVTLNRPQVRNALNTAMRQQLVAALEVALADPTVERVVVTGRGPAFCSGGDLSEFGTAPDPAAAHLVRTAVSPAASLAACASRMVVRVHGSCVGAGVELAAFAGRVVAAAGTTFRMPEVAMGLVPGAGGTVSIPRRVGRQRAAWLALSGEKLDAATALAWGLVDEISDEPGPVR
jgi:enoyl-CoA hydratase/carnithine racemase